MLSRPTRWPPIWPVIHSIQPTLLISSVNILLGVYLLTLGGIGVVAMDARSALLAAMATMAAVPTMPTVPTAHAQRRTSITTHRVGGTSLYDDEGYSERGNNI